MSGSSSVTTETVRRSLPRRYSTGHGIVGLEPGSQLDQPKPGQRLPLVAARSRLPAGEDRLAVQLGDQVAATGCPALAAGPLGVTAST